MNKQSWSKHYYDYVLRLSDRSYNAQIQAKKIIEREAADIGRYMCDWSLPLTSCAYSFLMCGFGLVADFRFCPKAVSIVTSLSHLLLHLFLHYNQGQAQLIPLTTLPLLMPLIKYGGTMSRSLYRLLIIIASPPVFVRPLSGACIQ